MASRGPRPRTLSKSKSEASLTSIKSKKKLRGSPSPYQRSAATKRKTSLPFKSKSKWEHRASLWPRQARFAEKVALNTPGPGAYVVKSRPLSAGITLSSRYNKGTGFMGMRIEPTPGPAAYFDKQPRANSPSKFTKATRWPIKKVVPTPGPGQYRADYLKRAPKSASLGKAAKASPMKQADTPGPGTYASPIKSLAFEASGRGFRMGGRKGSKLPEGPGPGYYNVSQHFNLGVRSPMAILRSRGALVGQTGPATPGPGAYDPYNYRQTFEPAVYINSDDEEFTEPPTTRSHCPSFASRSSRPTSAAHRTSRPTSAAPVRNTHAHSSQQTQRKSQPAPDASLTAKTTELKTSNSNTDNDVTGNGHVDVTGTTEQPEIMERDYQHNKSES